MCLFGLIGFTLGFSVSFQFQGDFDFKKVVDNEYFDRIRHILQHSKERYLALYKFKIKSYNDTSETKADDEVKTEEKYK